MKKHFIRAAILASLLGMTPAHAEGTAKEFLETIDGQDEGLTALHGLMLDSYALGLMFAVIEAATRGAPMAFCLPKTLVITTDQNIDILRRAMKEKPQLAEDHPAFALFRAYKMTFPCAATTQ